MDLYQVVNIFIQISETVICMRQISKKCQQNFCMMPCLSIQIFVKRDYKHFRCICVHICISYSSIPWAIICMVGRICWDGSFVFLHIFYIIIISFFSEKEVNSKWKDGSCLPVFSLLSSSAKSITMLSCCFSLICMGIKKMYCLNSDLSKLSHHSQAGYTRLHPAFLMVIFYSLW